MSDSKITIEHVVTESETVPELFPEWEAFKEMPSVFSTAHAIAFAEHACMNLLKGMEKSDYRWSLGYSVMIKHVGRAIPGDTVCATAKLIDTDYPIVKFKIDLFNKVAPNKKILEGVHERYCQAQPFG